MLARRIGKYVDINKSKQFPQKNEHLNEPSNLNRLKVGKIRNVFLGVIIRKVVKLN